MGVSGSGKTTIGAMLARSLGYDFIDGDDLHPAENIAKMRGGEALSDADRLPWLRAIAQTLEAWRQAGKPGVLACSALKRCYRDIIGAARPEVRFVYLAGSYEIFAARIAARTGHYMPPSLLRSQFDALEPPDAADAIIVDASSDPEALITAILAKL